MEEFSDIDIYIEVPDSCDIDVVKRQISDIAWEIGFEHEKVLQTVVYETPLKLSFGLA